MLLREPSELPPADLAPPVVAVVGDPFAELRVSHLLARVPRGESIRLRDIAARLEVEHLDWSFPGAVVLAAAVQLQADWRADHRSNDGIILTDGPSGPEIALEDSARMETWLIRQVERRREACVEALRRFALEDGPSG